MVRRSRIDRPLQWGIIALPFSHMDPELVRLFVEILSEILVIREEYAEDAEGTDMDSHLLPDRQALGAE